jgi:hypothetical protein
VGSCEPGRIDRYAFEALTQSWYDKHPPARDEHCQELVVL